MKFRVILQGTNEVHSEGDLLLGRFGETIVYDPADPPLPSDLSYWKVAHLAIVRDVWNSPVVVGNISHDAAWIENGSIINSYDIELWFYEPKGRMWLYPVEHDNIDSDIYFSRAFALDSTDHYRNTQKNDSVVAVWRIKCPACKLLH